MPSPPILGMYQSNGAFPTPGPSAWPSGPNTNLSATYIAWGQDWATYAGSFINKCNANGLLAFVELEPWNAGPNWNQTPLFSDITGGTWDTWLTGIGTAIAATGKPVILTFAHEMNVSGQYPWSQGDKGSGPGGGALTPSEWIAGWKYVHDKINSTANGQVIWMWACSAWTGGTTVDPSPWWPGASYVDAVGIDGYPNTQYGQNLGTFSGQIQQTVTAIRNLGWTDPIFLAETNLAQMVSSGGQSITAFVAAMYAAGCSGILEFEDTVIWGLPQMTAAQWTEYNNAIAANYGTPSGGGGGGTSGNKIGGLTEAFSGSTLDASKWYLEPDQPTGNPSGTYTIAGNKLNLSGGDYADTNYYTSVNSQNHYDLTGSAAYVQLFPNTSNADYDTGFGVFAGDFSNGYGFGVTGGNLYVQKTSSGAYTTLHTVAYNATNHAWLQISESGGTISFSTSPTGAPGSWTVQYSTSTETVNAWTATTSYIQLFYGSTSGSAKPSGVGSFAAFNGGTTSTGSSNGGTFAAVGSFIQTTGTSFSWTPAKVGNTLVVIAFSKTAGVPVTGVSSTNATWAQVVPDQTLGTTTVAEATAFLGTATKPSPATVNLATTATAGNLRVRAREFDSNGLPVALDSFVTMNGDAVGAVTAWPSVTPTKGGDELLFGFELNYNNVGGAAIAGTTPNTSYNVDANSNGGAFDLSVSSQTAVSWGDNDSRSVLVLLLYAQSSGGTGGTGGGGTPPPTGNTFWYDNAVITGLNAKAALLNGGSIQLYTGDQPALNSALTGTLLVTLTFSATAFASALASGGTVTAAANAVASAVAVATGTVGYFALVTSSGQTVLTGTVGDGSVSGADLVIPGLAIASGTTIACSAFSLTQSETGN